MRHLFSTRLRVILIIAMVLSIGLTIVSGAVHQSIPSLLVQGLMAPLKAGANALTEEAESFIIEEAYDPVYGARPLKRYIQKYVETLAAKLILADQVESGDTILIQVNNGALEAVVN